MRIDARFSLFKPSCVHRFLISGSDLRIDAGFSPFIPSFVHRFLISSPNLRIDASFSPETSFCLHRFLISGPNLRIDARFRLPNSYYQRCPRPILFFVAAGENGSACSGCGGNEFRIRFQSSLRQRRTARLQHGRGTQAGTGCHEGGIILSKKPPEWHLPLPQQRSASDSNLRRGKKE